MCRKGQAMVESLLAIVIITSVFLVLFHLAHLLMGKILLEHAAMRVARARAVGLNRCMCVKDARIAVISVAGKRLWPMGENEIGDSEALSRIPIYMAAPTLPIARGVLEYEYWDNLKLDIGDGTSSKAELETDWFTVSGKAGIERNADFYMDNEGR